MCSDLMEHYENGGGDFLARTVTGDETCLHHFEPQTKRQSMKWNNAKSPNKKKFKTAFSAVKVMATEFFNSEGLLLVDIMPYGIIISSGTYMATIKKLQARLCRVRPRRIGRSGRSGKFCCCMTMPRSLVSHKTTGEIRKIGCTILKHPRYSPYLTLCNYHLFRKVK